MNKRPRVSGTYRRREKVRTLYLTPSPNMPGLTDAERLALTLRRDASVAGRCVCGATFPPVAVRRPGEIPFMTMEHENDCLAANGPLFDRMLERIGGRGEIKYEPIVVELEVVS